MSETPLNATVVQRDDLNDYLTIVRVRPDSGELPAFEPGQFVTLGLVRDPEAAAPPAEPGKPARVRMIKRPYSIASAPTGVDYLEFLIILVERGRLTTRLWDVAAGGRVWLDHRILGDFTLDRAEPDRDLVMISTGTGIAPFVSMLRHYRGQGRWRRFVIINGVREVSDLAYRDELEAITREDPSVVYIPTVSRCTEGLPWEGIKGRATAALEPVVYRDLVGANLEPENCHVFLCGNPQMITDVETTLAARGFVTQTKSTAGNLHYERYW